MWGRVGILGLILLLRLVIGGVLSRSCLMGQEIRLAGIVDKYYQTDTKDFISIKNWEVELEKNRRNLEKRSAQVIGRCDRRVIDFLLGQNRLVEGQLYEVSEKTVAKTGLSLWLDNFRLRLVKVYDEQLPWPESALVAGIVLGYKSNLGEFYDQLVNAGVIHVVVASGYNVTIVGVVLLGILIHFVSRKWAVIGSLAGIWGYVFLAGGEPPIVRAAIMGGLVFIGKAYGKQIDIKWLLWLTAWVMVMFDPSLLVSVSFQLSVSATAGLMYFEPWVERRLEGVKWLLKTELAPTLAAQISTLPVILWHFGRVSFIAPLVNVLVLPLIPPLMGVGAIQLLLSLVYRPLGMMVGWVSYSLARVVVVLVQFFG